MIVILAWFIVMLLIALAMLAGVAIWQYFLIVALRTVDVRAATPERLRGYRGDLEDRLESDHNARQRRARRA